MIKKDLLNTEMTLRFLNTEVTFLEVPDEISLCINITNCPCHCKGCHSTFLWKDTGEFLTEESLKKLIDREFDGETGISCVCFMGGDISPYSIVKLSGFVKKQYQNKLKVAWYSGKSSLAEIAKDNLQFFDYVKIGPYIEAFGPLDKMGTNQKMFKVYHGETEGVLVDITHKFQKKS